MKRKFLLPILSVCMVVALVSVGFAAWLITGNSVEEAQGQFVTYGVTNKAFSLKASVSDNEKVVFGKPSDYSAQDTDWFIPDTDVENEDLTAEVTLTLTPDDENSFDAIWKSGYQVTVTLKSGTYDADSETFTATNAFDKAHSYDTDVTDALEYLALPTVTDQTLTGDKMQSGLSFTLDITKKENGSGNFTVAKDGKSATYTFTINFGWGKYFEVGEEGSKTIVNPYTYFNTLGNNPTNRAAAQKAMNAINAINALNNGYYEISLAVTEATSNNA